MNVLLLSTGLAATLSIGACSTRRVSSLLPATPAAGPELYGAGLFSTGAWDFFMAFSPDQRRVLFCKADSTFSTYEILETRLGSDGRWTPPAKPRFAAAWSNADPHFSPDGRTVFFISNRPAVGDAGAHPVYDIFSVATEGSGQWGEPERLPGRINLVAADKWSPSVAQNGDLYFGTERSGGRGGTDLWVARRMGGIYLEPENLGDSINTAGNEVEPWVAPDESYLIFSGLRRADGVGGYDLYISRRVNGSWGKARLLGPETNSAASEFTQSVSPDGKWLYFSSTRKLTGSLGARFDSPVNDRNIQGIGNGQGDIYRIRMTALDLSR